MPTSVGADDGCIRQTVAHGKKDATEGFVLAPVRTRYPDECFGCVIRTGAPPTTHRFASGCRMRNGHARLEVISMRAIAMNRWDTPQRASRQRIDASVPIFVSPAATLAVCLMVFGVLHTVATVSAERVAIDGLLVVNASFYVAAALLAKFAWRVRSSVRCLRLARYANNLSIAGLIMTIVGTCCLVLVIAIKA